MSNTNLSWERTLVDADGIAISPAHKQILDSKLKEWRDANPSKAEALELRNYSAKSCRELTSCCCLYMLIPPLSFLTVPAWCVCCLLNCYSSIEVSDDVEVPGFGTFVPFETGRLDQSQFGPAHTRKQTDNLADTVIDVFALVAAQVGP